MSEKSVPKNSKDLEAWLAHIESLHPKSIAMGLERVNQVIKVLNIVPSFPIITVAGTNGKGSTCAMLEQIYTQAGYRVGCYTSPHLLRYNERVRVNCKEVSDTVLCAAFEVIDAARQSASEDNTAVALTYFEVGTLAAVWHFVQADIDVAILEIGLGGRLDAVNAFEPECAIVTSVDLDHMEFLGDTREKIAYEKAGVYRTSKPAICGDANPPASLIQYANQIGADLKLIHRDFDATPMTEGWYYTLNDPVCSLQLPLPALKGGYQLNNAASAITAVECLQKKIPVPVDAIENAMLAVQVIGRFQTTAKAPDIILDVAHNPHAARALASNLKNERDTKPHKLTFAVFAMLGDKDIAGVVDAVREEIDVWYISDINHVRGAKAQDLAKIVTSQSPNASIKVFDTITKAYQQACIDADENDKILVFGSFFTVSSVMQTQLDPNSVRVPK